MKVSRAKYEQIALADPSGGWELDCGRLRRKPPMTFEHNRVQNVLGFFLQAQLDLRQYAVEVNSGRTQRTDENYYIPDVMVVPMAITGPLRHRRDVLEAYTEPLPLVVEVWLPSTGAYDVDTKIPEYQRRGDREIWRLHPFERTLIAWRRQPDRGYSETRYEGGIVEPVALSGVRIDLDALFSL